MGRRRKPGPGYPRAGHDAAHQATVVRPAGLTLTVAGLTVRGVAFLPLTIRVIPDGLPSRTRTWCFSSQVIDLPAWMTPLYSILPVASVMPTQQSWVAVSLICASPGG